VILFRKNQKTRIRIKINYKIKKLIVRRARRRNSKKFCNRFNIKTPNYKINKEKANDRIYKDKTNKDKRIINNKKLLEIILEIIHN